MRQLNIMQNITNRSEGQIQRYFNDVSKISVLSLKEEIYYSNLAKQGDVPAKIKLIEANLRFVVSVAKQYQHKGLSLMDLINEGNLGLIEAIPKFDGTKGFKFITFAVWDIRKTILTALRSKSRIVRLPVGQISNLSKVMKSRDRLTQELERTPELDEIVKDTELTKDMVFTALSFEKDKTSFDAPLLSSDRGETLYSIFPSDTFDIESEIKKSDIELTVEKLLSILNPKEKHVIKSFYGIGTPITDLDHIAEKLNITREGARRIKERANAKLKLEGSKLLSSGVY